MEKTAYFEVADADGYVFSNCKYEDLLVYTDVPSQAIHIGNTLNDMSAFMIRENDVNVLRSMSVGKSNPNYPLDVLGNASIDGNIMSTKYVVSRGFQVKRRLAGFFSNPALPSGIVAGFSNDLDGVVISINSNNSNNYIKFMASNTQVLYVNGQGVITVSGSILPLSAQEYNLGAPTSRFNEAYLNAVTLGTMRIAGKCNAVIMPNTIISSSLTMSNWGQTTLYTSNAYLSIGKSNPSEALDILSNIKISSNAYVMSRIGIATSNPSVSLDVNGTDAILIPRGTTGQRPGITTQGQIRYNTTLSTFEGFGPGGTWGSLGGVKDTNQDTYITTEVVTGSNDDTIRFYNSNIETMRLRRSNLEVNVSTTFYKTTSLLPTAMSAVYPYLPPAYTVTSSNFTISGQSYGNGAYTILGSSLFNNFTTYQAAFDQDITGRWMSAQTFLGPGRIYNSNQVTPAANGSNYSGEWLQITIPNTIVPTKLRMITGINNSTYAVDTFTFLGSSNNGSTWKPFLSSIGTTGWPTNANSNLALSYNINESDTFTTFRLVFYKSYSDLIYVNYVAIDGYMPAPPIPPKLGVGLSNPREDVDILGNLRASSNAYILNRIAIGHSNPTEALDIQGNLIASSNIYANYRIGVAKSNPQESLDVQGNIQSSSNLYAAACIGVATSNPQEPLHVLGNAKVSSNLYVLAQTAFGHSNSTETLDILGNIKGSSNLYIMSRMGLGTSNPSEVIDAAGNIKGSNIYSAYRLGIATSNPTESLDLLGNLKASSNIYAMARLGISTSNPTESLDLLGNFKASSNIYAISRIAIGSSNPRESLDLMGNMKASSNIYAQYRLGISTSNPTESLEVQGNAKVSQSMYVLSNLGIGTSNPAVALEVTGNAKVSSNLEVVGNLIIRGITTTVDSTTVTVKDNVLRLNNGAAYSSSLQAGLEINRGSGSNDYLLVFDEPSNYFKVGQQGQLQTVATRDDNPASHSVMIYDSVSKKLTACNSLTFSNNILEVQGIMSTKPSAGSNAFQGLATGLTSGQFLHIALGQSNTPSNAAMIKYTHNGLNNNTNNAQFGLWGFNHITCVGNGNVGVNTASPAEALHVTGKIFASTNQILAYTGDTALVPAYSWGDDSNTGIYHPTTDTIAFTNNGSETMRIDSVGNVGIGKTNPGVRLDVNGTLNATTLQQNGSTLNNILSSYATTSSLSSYALSSSLSSYATTGSLSSYVTNSSLSSTLSSYATTSSVNGKLNTSGGNISGSLNVSGNLGVGTTNPSAPLHVIAKQNDNPEVNGLYVFNPANSAGNHAIVAARVGGASGGNPWLSLDVANAAGWSIGMDNADDRKLKIRRDWKFSGNDVLTITNNNFVGIGTTTPLAPLHVAGSANGSVEYGTASYFSNGNNSIGQAGQYGTNWSVRANDHYGGVGFVSISDARIKKDIESIEIDLSKLMKLRPVSYQYKDDIQRGPRKRFGFIAQEVAQVLPETIHKSTDCIPDIYVMASYNAIDKTLTFSKNVQDIKLQCNDVLQVFMKKSSNNICLCKVIDIHIEDEKQTCIVSVEQVSKAEPLPTTSEEVFVFGRQVDDFMNLNYEDALTWAFAQMQAIYKTQNNLIIDLCQRVQTLEGQLGRSQCP